MYGDPRIGAILWGLEYIFTLLFPEFFYFTIKCVLPVSLLFFDERSWSQTVPFGKG